MYVDGKLKPSAGEENRRQTLCVAQVACDERSPITELGNALGAHDFAQICLFISPQADFDALTAEAARRFAPKPLPARVRRTTQPTSTVKGVTSSAI